MPRKPLLQPFLAQLSFHDRCYHKTNRRAALGIGRKPTERFSGRGGDFGCKIGAKRSPMGARELSERAHEVITDDIGVCR